LWILLFAHVLVFFRCALFMDGSALFCKQEFIGHWAGQAGNPVLHLYEQWTVYLCCRYAMKTWYMSVICSWS